NLETRTVEGRVEKSVPVRSPPWAPNLLLTNTAIVIRRPIEKRFDRSSQRQLLPQLIRLVEVAAQPLRLGEIVVAQTSLDFELRIFFGERAHPLFDLTTTILVAVAALEIGEKRLHDTFENLQSLLLELFFGHVRRMLA